MKIQAPPGMRDFYPADMRLQNWLFDAWRRVSRSFGFEEFEGPIFEYLDLYTTKSGEGIVSELFTFEDRGERRFAIRPEMTPTLARMVAARANALPRPIKWFSIPRMCRAEKPQRGRLREFFQWNLDVLGTDDGLADAEVIAAAIEFFRQVGCTNEDFVVDMNSRGVASEMLIGLGVPAEQLTRAFEFIDRSDRTPTDVFKETWNATFGGSTPYERLENQYLNRDFVTSMYESDTARSFWQTRRHLNAMGFGDYLRVNPRLVRGIAYYTGTVFEIRDTAGHLRALAGGGRYDNLTEVFGGPKVLGVGFGMGDAPVFEFLKEIGKLPELSGRLDVFVIDAAGGDSDASPHFEKAMEIVRGLRAWRDAKTSDYLTVDFSYKRQALGKQLKQAAARNARFAVIVGDETRERGVVTIKYLETGEQKPAAVAELLTSPREVLHFPTILIA